MTFFMLIVTVVLLSGLLVQVNSARLGSRTWGQDDHALTFPRSGSTCDQNTQHSPYRLQYYSSTDIPGGNLVCFHVLLVPCDPLMQCCSGQDLFKAEFDVEPGCKASLQRLTLDGEPHDFEFNTAQRLLRVTDLSRDASNAAGTQLCLTLTGTCTDLSTLCANKDGQCRYALFNGGRRDCCPVGHTGGGASHAAVVLPETVSAATASAAVTSIAVAKPKLRASSLPLVESAQFPYVSCQRNAAASRYSLSDASISPFLGADPASDLTRICFSVKAEGTCSAPPGLGAMAGAACCDFDLHKVEFDVSAECYGALSYVSVGAVRRPPFFQSAANPTIKITNLALHASAAQGTEICLFMRKQCATLEQLCRRTDGKCEYSIFGGPQADGNARCCPVGLAGTMV